MARIVVQDLFDELRDENSRLVNELNFCRKCIRFLEEFKDCLKNAFENCIYCNQNFDIQTKVTEFELKYNPLISGNNDIKPTISSEGFPYDSQDFDHQIHGMDPSIGSTADDHRSQQFSCANSEVVSDIEDQNQGSDECLFSAGERQRILQKSLKKKKCAVEGCGKRFSDIRKKKRMESHLNCKHFNIKPYMCDVCERQFGGEEHLIHHRKSHLDLNEIVSKTNDTIDYESVDQDLSDLSKEDKMKRIFNKSLSQMICAFDDCRKKFKDKDKRRLEAHLNAKHFNVKPYMCDICNKQFSGEEYLLDHMKRHSTVTIECDFEGCSYQTNLKKNLVKHQKFKHPDYQPNTSKNGLTDSSNDNNVTEKRYNIRKQTNKNYSSIRDEDMDSDATIEDNHMSEEFDGSVDQSGNSYLDFDN